VGICLYYSVAIDDPGRSLFDRGDILMSDQSERIRAALLRFKTTRSAVGSQPFKPIEPEELARQFVVVNEQNLAELFLSSVGRPNPKPAARKPAITKGS